MDSVPKRCSAKFQIASRRSSTNTQGMNCRNLVLFVSAVVYAADVYVNTVGALRVAKWIVEFARFDRLYFYGNDRPIHVSVGPDNARAICILRNLPGTKRRIPRQFAVADFLALENG